MLIDDASHHLLRMNVVFDKRKKNSVCWVLRIHI